MQSLPVVTFLVLQSGFVLLWYVPQKGCYAYMGQNTVDPDQLPSEDARINTALYAFMEYIVIN